METKRERLQAQKLAQSQFGDSSDGQSTNDSLNSSKYGYGLHHDEGKVQSMIAFFSRLESSSHEEVAIHSNHDGENKENPGTLSNQQSSSNDTTKNVLLRFERAFLMRLYKANYVILEYQAISHWMYHLIILLEFLQMLFYIFYRVNVANEFHLPTPYQSYSGDTYQLTEQPQTSNFTNKNKTKSNTTATDISNYNFEEQPFSLSERQATFRIDNYFRFINFHLYALSGKQQDFFIAYVTMYGLFIVTLVTMFVFANKLFNSTKTGTMKDSSRYIVTALSILIMLYLTLLQIPFMTLLFQGYLCDENDSQEYIVQGIACDGKPHKALIVTSSIFLTIYIIFIVMMKQLFMQKSIESKLPWAQFDRKLTLIRAFIRFFLSISFTFDKNGDFKPHIVLACSLITSYIIFKRCIDAFFFNTSVQKAVTFYEVASCFLFLILSIHSFIDNSNTNGEVTVSITQIFILFIICLFLAGLSLLIQHKRKMRLLGIYSPREGLRNAYSWELYLFRLNQMIERHTSKDQLWIQGIFSNHAEICKQDDCGCAKIADNIDDLKLYKEQQKTPKIGSQSRGKVSSTVTSGFTFGLKKLPKQQSEQMPYVQMGIISEAVQLSHVQSDASLVHVQSFSEISDNIGPPEAENKEPPQNIFESIQKTMIQNKQTINQSDESELQQYQRNIDLDSSFYDKEWLQRQFFKFLAIQTNWAIKTYPKNIDLRIFNSYLQKSKFNNQFKAIFELMNCQACKPTIQERFIIFSRKIEIEKEIIKEYQKQYLKFSNTIDVDKVFNFEKWFQRFQHYEYLAVNSAIRFWRELLSKSLKTSNLQERGAEISRYYKRIQEIVRHLQKIYADDIKLLYRYGLFLINIINHEYAGMDCFIQARNVYFSEIVKKSKTTPVNQVTTFGENTASSIVIISATFSTFGTIVHANDEVEHMLGYNRKELLDQNVRILMPVVIGDSHDRFIKKYLDTSRNAVIDKQRQNFAVNKKGYLQEVELLVKVLPQLTGKIVFVGFMQRVDKILSLVDSPKTEYEHLESQFIITDSRGYILNVTETLAQEIGLSSKFFNNYNMHNQVSLQKIFPYIFDPDIFESVELDGVLLQIDTTRLLEFVELENLSSEEILECKSNVGHYKGYVQGKRQEIDQDRCCVYVYRVILINKNTLPNEQSGASAINMEVRKGRNAPLTLEMASWGELGELGTATQMIEDSESNGENIMSMASSQISSISVQQNSIIKDFKHTLGDRVVPRSLTILDRLIMCIMAVILTLSIVDISILENEVSKLINEADYLLMEERRMIEIVQIASNFRSYINVANGLEFDEYEIENLKKIQLRFEHLGVLLQREAASLSSVHQFLTMQRQDENLQQNDFEYQPILLYRMNEQNRISRYEQPFRIALFTYLNNILQLNQTKEEKLILPLDLISQQPDGSQTKQFKNLTSTQKATFFLMTNGIRSLRTRSEEAKEFQVKTGEAEMRSDHILPIMIVGILATIISIITVIYQIVSIEHMQSSIFSLYAKLDNAQIREAYQRCSYHMDQINNGTFITNIVEQHSPEALSQKQSQAAHHQPSEQHFINHQGESCEVRITLRVSDEDEDPREQWCQNRKIGKNTKPQEANDEVMSEEEKEQLYQAQYIKKRNHEKKRMAQKVMTKRGGIRGRIVSDQLFSMIVKKAQEEIKAIEDREEQLNQEIKKEIEKEESDSPQSPGTKNADVQTFTEQFTSVRKEIKQIKRKENRKKQKIHQRLGVPKSMAHKEADKSIMKDDNSMVEESKDEIIESKSEGSFSHRHSDLAKKHSKKKEKDENKKDNSHCEIDVAEQRKDQFRKTMKSQNTLSKILTVLIGVIFCSYFVFVLISQKFYRSQLHILEFQVPTIFNRYRYLMLSYTLLKERIIYNNSLESFEKQNIYGQNIDKYYHEMSLDNERELQQLFLNVPNIMEKLQTFMAQSNSNQFCSSIIKQAFINNSPSSAHYSYSKEQQQQSQYAYQAQINTVVRACQAASTGKIYLLEQLRKHNVDLNQGNFDMQTPLHVAVRGNQTQVVKYLLNEVQGIKVNLIDRWGATPLNCVANSEEGREIERILIQHGASRSNETFNVVPLERSVNLTDNDIRLFYAAYFGDIVTSSYLLDNGQEVNVINKEGRTPLHIASAEGHIELAKYLISRGADVTIVDSRGYDPVFEALREGHIALHEYLDSIIVGKIIEQHCPLFGEGIFKQGMLSAMGIFQKKFTDVQIWLNQLQSYSQLLSLLNQGSEAESFKLDNRYSLSQQIFKAYFSAQELYISRVLNMIADVVTQSYEQYSSEYLQQCTLIFATFVAIQLLIVFVIRKRMLYKMKQEVFESRGILNLIPNRVIQQNKKEVETIIKKLKD